MIEIDGSYGEGGGQIVRTAVALSAATGKNIKIHSIRKNRPNSGLRHQHVKTLETAARICNAKTNGVFLNSSSIEFFPREIEGGLFQCRYWNCRKYHNTFAVYHAPGNPD